MIKFPSRAGHVPTSIPRAATKQDTVTGVVSGIAQQRVASLASSRRVTRKRRSLLVTSVSVVAGSIGRRSRVSTRSRRLPVAPSRSLLMGAAGGGGWRHAGGRGRHLSSGHFGHAVACGAPPMTFKLTNLSTPPGYIRWLSAHAYAVIDAAIVVGFPTRPHRPIVIDFGCVDAVFGHQHRGRATTARSATVAEPYEAEACLSENQSGMPRARMHPRGRRARRVRLRCT